LHDWANDRVSSFSNLQSLGRVGRVLRRERERERAGRGEISALFRKGTVRRLSIWGYSSPSSFNRHRSCLWEEIFTELNRMLGGYRWASCCRRLNVTWTHVYLLAQARNPRQSPVKWLPRAHRSPSCATSVLRTLDKWLETFVQNTCFLALLLLNMEPLLTRSEPLIPLSSPGRMAC
jgi:hypothetical protein